MKVRAIKILHPSAGELEYHPEVTVGSTYLVRFVSVHPEDGPWVAIIDDLALADPRSSRGSFWPIEMFETVDDRIPSNWVCRYDEDGFLNLAPASWLVEGFWGDDYSTRPISLEERRQMNADYHRELEIIKRECG